MPTIPSDRPGSEVRDLSGTVSDGDDLPSAINSALDDGVQVYVPPGEYTGRHSDLNFSADDATIYGDPQGVSIQCEMDSNATMSTGGTLRIENIDIRGKKPEEQVKIDVDLSGGTLEWVNFNFPDGTTNPTDSYVARCDSGTGHHFIQNCYIGPHGNSAFYYSERNTQEMDVTFKGCAFHNCANPIRMGNVVVEDCIYLADGTVPDFIDIDAGGQVDEGTPRMFKFEGGGHAVVRNSDVLITSNAGPADGPCVDWGGEADESNTVEVIDSRFGNSLGREIFDTASAPSGAAENSSLSNVSAVTTPHFSGPEISGDISDGTAPRKDIESRRWNPLSGQSNSGQGSDGGGSFGLPASFEVITGSEATPPNTDSKIWTPVDGATAPEDPSGGDSGSSDGSNGSDSGSDDSSSQDQRTFVLEASPDNPDANCTVSFTASGEITFGSESEQGTDKITQNPDGSYTATSVEMDPGATDSYNVAGTVSDYSVPDGYDVSVSVDGTTTSFAELVDGESGSDGGDTGSGDGDSGSTDGGTDSNDDGSGSTDESTGSGDGGSGSTDDGSGDGSDGGSQPGKILVVDGTGDADEVARYEVAVTGELTRDEQRSEVVDGGLPWDRMVDYVSNNRVAGVVGNGRDAYRFTGEITAADVSGQADFKLLRE